MNTFKDFRRYRGETQFYKYIIEGSISKMEQCWTMQWCPVGKYPSVHFFYFSFFLCKYDKVDNVFYN